MGFRGAKRVSGAGYSLPAHGGPEATAEYLAKRLESLLDLAGLPRTLDHCGVKPSDIPRLAEEAARQWTAQFNPRPVAATDFQQLYSRSLDPRLKRP